MSNKRSSLTKYQVATIVAERAMLAMKDRNVPWQTAADRLITIALAEAATQIGAKATADLLRAAAADLDNGKLNLFDVDQSPSRLYQ